LNHVFPRGAVATRGISGLAVFSNGPGKDAWTTFADLSQWPPRFETIWEFALGVAQSDGGRLLTVSSTREHPYRYRARVRRGSWASQPTILGFDGPAEQLGLSNGGFVGERVVGFHKLDADHKLPGMPLLESEAVPRHDPAHRR